MFIPLKDENPVLKRPYATFALIIINCLVYFISIMRTPQEFQIFVYKFGLIPMELVHMEEVTPMYSWPLLLSPISSMFLHGGFMHLAGNMLYLWIFGNNIEDHLGPVKFVIFYIVSGLAASLLFVVFSPNSQIPLVGASGAIAGVMGAYIVLFPRARILTLLFLFYFIRIIRVPAMVMLGFWFVYQLFMSAAAGGSGGVAWLAHVGGFAFGFLWFKLLGMRGNKGPRRIYLD